MCAWERNITGDQYSVSNYVQVQILLPSHRTVWKRLIVSMITRRTLWASKRPKAQITRWTGASCTKTWTDLEQWALLVKSTIGSSFQRTIIDPNITTCPELTSESYSVYNSSCPARWALACNLESLEQRPTQFEPCDGCLKVSKYFTVDTNW